MNRIKKTKNNLAVYRGLAGLTQQQLADSIGASRHSVSSWENRSVDPHLSPASIKKICVTLGISADDFIDCFL